MAEPIDGILPILQRIQADIAEARKDVQRVDGKVDAVAVDVKAISGRMDAFEDYFNLHDGINATKQG
jgi:hypothetical protein